MNPYEILNLKKNKIIKDENSILDKSITDSTINLIMKKINTLREMCKDPSDLEKLLETFDIIIFDIMRDINAYHAIASSESRKIHGKTDIDMLTAKRFNSIMNSLHLKVRSSMVNPFQIFSMVKDNDEYNDVANINESIRNRAFSRFNFLLSKEVDQDIVSIEKLFKQLLKYNWAYKALKTPESRQNLKFRLIKDSANKNSSFMGNITCKTFKEPIKVTLGNESTNNFIQIVEGRELRNKPFNLDEEFLHEYMIIRKINDTQYERAIVYSNIDMNRMKIDVDYQRMVTEQLLKRSSIVLGKKFLDGYIGEFNDRGIFEYNNENLAGLIQYNREKEKRDKVKKNNQHENR